MTTSHSKKYHKANLKMIVSFYKKMYKSGVIQEGGSAYSRMLYLQTLCGK